jgi:AcrR family transcriptional regulator
MPDVAPVITIRMHKLRYNAASRADLTTEVDIVNLDIPLQVDVVNPKAQHGNPVTSDTRTMLVKAAGALLDRGGPSEVKLREVGKLAGFSHNAPYKHFADKEELLAAIAAEELRSQSQLMRQLAAAQQPIAALRTLAHLYADWARAKPARFKLTFGAWKKESNELREAVEESRTLLVSIVKAAQSRFELPKSDPERLAALMLALAHGAVDQALAGHLSSTGKGNADPEDLFDDLLRYLTKSAGQTRKPKKGR